MADQLQEKGYGKRPLWQWIVIYAVVAIVVYGLIYFIFFKKSNPYGSGSYSYNQTQQSTSQSTAPQSSNSLTIEYTQNGFAPSSITINKGQTVTWVNKSSGQMWVASNVHPVHSAYDGTTLSQHCTGGAGSSFDECQAVGQGQSFSFTFDKVGSWGFHNHMSPGDGGTVVVK